MSFKKRSDLLSALLLLLSTSLILWALFKPIIKSPGNFLFGSGGDALKNYYTYLYYSLYDSGHHFSGMNYPFGEHVVFTDSQPVFSFLTNLVNRVMPLSAFEVIGVMNFGLLLGLLAGAFFIYLILRKNLLPAWYAIITANLILFLNPQFMRMQNHYALSYSFIVPATWYFLIRIFENRRNPIWYAVYIAFGLFTAFIHPYFLLIGAFLALAYTLVYFLQEVWNFKKHAWFLLRLLLTAIAPVILFQLWLAITDTISDRPKSPYGFLIYRATFESVFFPTEDPFKTFWRELFKTEEPIWEGYAYVGILGLLVLGLTLWLVLKYLIRGRFNRIFRPVLPLPLRTGIWAAILTLLFSMGIPFTFNLEFLLDYLPPLKQFRSIGRFAWIFYYVYSVYVAFFFYRLYRYLNLKGVGKFTLSLLLIVFLVWGLDAKINVQRKVKEMNSSDSAISFVGNNNNYTQLLALAGRNASEFQAILSFPYFLVGSEFYAHVGSGFSLFEAQRASVNLHLPIATGMLSRTSFRQTLDMAQLLSSNMIRKEILSKYPNRKPLLLVVTNENLEPIEQGLVNMATRITAAGNITLYELPLSALEPNLPARVRAFESNKNTFTEKNGIYTSEPGAAIVVKGFEDQPSEEFLFDKGAAFTPKGNLPLFNAPIPGAADTTTYEVSVWWQMSPDRWFSALRIKRFDQNGTLLEEKSQPMREITDIYQSWTKSTLEIKLQNATDRLEIYLEADGSRADNLVIRPKGTDVYYYTNQGRNLIMNNYQIK